MPHSGRWIPVLAIALGGLMVALAPTSLSHQGTGSELVVFDRVEAEGYESPDEARESCEGRDGEHTQPVPDPSASGRQHLFIPYGDGCGVTFEDVIVPVEGSFDRLRVQPTKDEDLCREVTVLADGVQVARAEFCGDSDASGWETYSFDEATTVAPGQYDLRIEHDILPGSAEWRNLRIDWVSFEPAPLG